MNEKPKKESKRSSGNFALDIFDGVDEFGQPKRKPSKPLKHRPKSTETLPSDSDDEFTNLRFSAKLNVREYDTKESASSVSSQDGADFYVAANF